MSFRGDSVASDIQKGLGFIQNPIGAVTSFLTDQLLGSIFGEDTHLMYLRWLAAQQAAEAAGAKRSAVAKRAIARSALYGATPTATRLSTYSPSRLQRIAALAKARRNKR